MKTLHFDGFQVIVPETSAEKYEYRGAAPAQIKKMCENLNKKAFRCSPKIVASMIQKEVKATLVEII